MKIIGINYNSYVVEVDGTELCRIVAEDITAPAVWTNADQARRMIGKEYDVNKAYDRIRALKNNAFALKTIIGQLKAMGELLEPVAMEIEQKTNQADDFPV